MPSVRIFQPAKNAMQSGRANTQAWVIEFAPTDAVKPSPMMGWAGSTDTHQQVRLSFDNRGDAIDYAKKNGLDYEGQPSRNRSGRIKAYSDNFRANRQGNWTH